jgi:hypothetical protein
MSVVPNTGITIVKQFVYRDEPEEWSNHYWLSGAILQTSASFKALADELITLERPCYSARSKVVSFIGYDASETDPIHNKPPQSVASHDYVGAEALPGTLSSATGHFFAGDQAGFVWWKTSRRSKAGKPVYLRKYFHDGFESFTDVDQLATEVAAAYTTFGVNMTAGLPAIEGRVIQSHLGAESLAATGHGAWVTTRTLKRRGKRPLAARTASPA